MKMVHVGTFGDSRIFLDFGKIISEKTFLEMWKYT